MKYLILILFLPISLFSQDNEKYNQQELDLIELNESIYREYVINHNTDFFNKEVNHDFVLVAAIGHLENKKQVIAGVKNLDINFLNVTVESIILKRNVGILIGLLEMKGTIMGRPIPGNVRFMSVFINEEGNWKLQSRSMTPIRKMPKP